MGGGTRLLSVTGAWKGFIYSPSHTTKRCRMGEKPRGGPCQAANGEEWLSLKRKKETPKKNGA